MDFGSGTAPFAAMALLWLAPTSPASAATGASDIAVPVYRTNAAATTANRFDCNGYRCQFVINTQTTPYPCSMEMVTLASGQPALLYRDTYCNVAISGTFEAGSGEEGPCALYAVQTLKVRFTSGANALFTDSFDVSGLFKPTAFSTDRERITQAQVTVTGSSALDSTRVGTGAVSSAVFTVRFPGAGLHSSMCYPYATGANAGYVAAVRSHGTVTVAP